MEGSGLERGADVGLGRAATILGMSEGEVEALGEQGRLEDRGGATFCELRPNGILKSSPHLTQLEDAPPPARPVWCTRSGSLPVSPSGGPALSDRGIAKKAEAPAIARTPASEPS